MSFISNWKALSVLRLCLRPVSQHQCEDYETHQQEITSGLMPNELFERSENLVKNFTQ